MSVIIRPGMIKRMYYFGNNICMSCLDEKEFATVPPYKSLDCNFFVCSIGHKT